MRQLTNTAGAITDSYEYDAFGNSFTVSGSTPNTYLYRGEQFDPDLNLYYLSARYYNPLTGRFMSRDPIAGKRIDPRTLHKYLYAGGDPVNLIDPSGRDSILETGSIDDLIGRAPVPALVELAGGAYATAAASATQLWTTAVFYAATMQQAVLDFFEAASWVALAEGITKLYLCQVLAQGLEEIIKNAAGYEGELPPNLLLVDEAEDKFREVCVEFVGNLTGLK